MADYVIHPLAMAEYLAAHAHYLTIGLRLAGRFERAFDRAIAAIAAMPEAWPLVDDTYRFYKLRRFPYLVIYRLDVDLVVIAEVRHQRRRPDSWKGR